MLTPTQIKKLRKILKNPQDVDSCIIECYDIDRDFYDRVGKKIKEVRQKYPKRDLKAEKDAIENLLKDVEEAIKKRRQTIAASIIALLMSITAFVFLLSIKPACLAITPTSTAQQRLDAAQCLVEQSKYKEAAQVLLTDESEREFLKVRPENQWELQGKELITLTNILGQFKADQLEPNTWADVSLLRGRLAEAKETTTKAKEIYENAGGDTFKQVEASIRLGRINERIDGRSACGTYSNGYKILYPAYQKGEVTSTQYLSLLSSILLNTVYVANECNYTDNPLQKAADVLKKFLVLTNMKQIGNFMPLLHPK